jgi:4a-hydroxytetrahydrobiopterin dehydratase
MAMAVLNEQELNDQLSGLDGWDVHDGALHKRYSFGDFASALAFANRVGGAAEAADHHPDLAVGWGYVEVSWVSHSDGGITARDVDMAARCDELASSG